jgi:hypothetical protein
VTFDVAYKEIYPGKVIVAGIGVLLGVRVLAIHFVHPSNAEFL